MMMDGMCRSSRALEYVSASHVLKHGKAEGIVIAVFKGGFSASLHQSTQDAP